MPDRALKKTPRISALLPHTSSSLITCSYGNSSKPLTRRIRVCGRFLSLSLRNIRLGNGTRAFVAPVEHRIDNPLYFPRPIITFIVILLLPSALTFLTLLIHRIRAARAAQRDRAPEAIVHSLPWCVWSGPGCEKHEGSSNTAEDSSGRDPDPTSPVTGETDQSENSGGNPSSSHGTPTPAAHPWFDNQVECAICLSEFVKGERIRILPCHHIFHLDEVDSWLIQRKKLVRLLNFAVSHTVPHLSIQCPVCKADVTKPQLNDQPRDLRSRIAASLSRNTSPNAPNERTPLLRQEQDAQP